MINITTQDIFRERVKGITTSEKNSQIFGVRIYASSGTSPGRGGSFGADSTLFLNVASAFTADGIWGLAPSKWGRYRNRTYATNIIDNLLSISAR
jgi:hypothetical protein